MNDVTPNLTAQVRRYTQGRQWLRGLWKNSVHSASGSVLAALGTNGVEGMAPDFARQYVEGIGMNFSQVIAVFAVSLVYGALRFVHVTTAPGGTTPPMPVS